MENEPAREESGWVDESLAPTDTTDGSIPDETRADESTSDEPIADEPTADEPEPTADEPGAENDPSGDSESRPEIDPCANVTCNNRGWCSRGGCICDPGYAGSGCTSCKFPWIYDSVATLCRPTTEKTGTSAGEALDGNRDDDWIRGMDGDDTVRGLEGNDFVNGNQGNDFVNGNQGDDEVHGGIGDDSVHGGEGNDAVYGDDGNDLIYGDLGNDRLIGGNGDDRIEGGDGDDRYVIDGLGNDTFTDQSGYDEARCLPGLSITSDTMEFSNRKLTLSNGYTVTIEGNGIEAVLGCN